MSSARLCLRLCLCLAWASLALAEFDLVLIHTNDMHARLDEISSGGGTCPPGGKCYGGFARIKAAATAVRQAKSNVIFLNAGDSFQGSPFYSVYKWRIIAKFVDALGMDAMSLGNHEFDDGVNGLAPYLTMVKTPCTVCNIDFEKEPGLQGVNLHKWISLNVSGVHIGVVGYLTPDTMFLSQTEDVFLSDEVDSIRKTAREAREAGAQIVIAVGHSGYDMDCRIAKEVENIDLVVGGHTNTFLYTGTPPDIEVPADVYPHIETQQSGKRVPVVQAFAWTKYLGYLELKFNDNFEIVSYEGNPILMDRTKPKDETVENELKEWKEALSARTAKYVGSTSVDLDGNCRQKECNLGNMVADALYEYGENAARKQSWPSVPLVIYNGGGVRSSIAINSTGGNLTMGDVLTVSPFENQLRLVKVNGSVLKQTFEVSVKEYDPTGVILKGAFLQMSGIKVEYDLSKEPGDRVRSLKARCDKCTDGYEEVEEDKDYLLIVPSFLAEGGDGYMVLKNKGEHVAFIDDSDTQVVVDYVANHSPVSASVEGRITFYEGEDEEGVTSGASPTLA